MTSTTFTTFVRHAPAVLCAGLFLSITSTASLADQRCQQLEALNRQYAGVSLTTDQKMLKRRLVAWYKQNCSSRRADAGH
ncbi:MAG: hypothetical protein QOG83_2642 [Alphaproteobacteria bacterium]|jgi:hypothetical protein|nr:hypothetical protein [Alphaproteobacteria bacterium]